MVQAAIAPTKTLQELIVAAHFHAPLPLGVLDLADWVGLFSDYPIIQELPALPLANVPVAGAQPISFQLNLPNSSLPRMFVRSPDGRYSIQLQGDRIAIGWSRIEPLGVPADYPGFEAMLERWQTVLSRFEAWTQRRFRVRPTYRLAEVNYANAAPLQQESQRKRMSEIFRFVQPTGRPVNAFNTTWMESVYPVAEDNPVFRSTVTASVSLGQAPPAIPVVGFNFIGIAVVAEGQESKHIMRDIHDKIREIYQSAIVVDAH